MKKRRKLDIFNLFYSGAAVIILIGVIAKLLEWEVQDFFMTLGLSIEALVFAVSAIKFVEVEKSVGATEATLSKVAEGLGSLQPMGGGSNAPYINIQTVEPSPSYSTVNYDQQKVDISNFDTERSKSQPSGNLSIEIKAPSSTESPIATVTSIAPIALPVAASLSQANTLWQLEQLDILSLSKDLFYQPDWNKLNSEEYTQLSQLFKRVFGKKIPNKEALPFLMQSLINLPSSPVSDLSISKPAAISLAEISLLCKASTVAKLEGIFNQFIFEEKANEPLIRTKMKSEIQIFGGEAEGILVHANAFYPSILIPSPVTEGLDLLIASKGKNLLNYLIDSWDGSSEEEGVSLADILVTADDGLKKRALQRFKKLTYAIETGLGYPLLKSAAKIATSMTDLSEAKQLIKKILSIEIETDNLITLDDVVNFHSEIIYFGLQNEYSVLLTDIFLKGELNYIKLIRTIVDKLYEEGVSAKPKLNDIFDIKDGDSKKEIFDKLNYHLSKTNTIASGTQLAFNLLYKQYS
jgi:hypothetical protein